MAARVAWVLNLDADLELGATNYSSRKSVKSAMRPYAERLATTLLGPGDLWIDELVDVDAKGFVGRAFCPTPRAIELLRRAGADPEPHPGVDVVRRVNSRAFAAALGPTLPGAAFVTDLEHARMIIGGAPAVGRGWRVKRAFGTSGRGQRVIGPGPLNEADVRLLRSWLDPGVQIEPNVVIEREHAIHGMLGEDRSLRLGRVVEQRCDAQGAWIATEPCADGPFLDDEARRVAAALADAGYFGPFGIDAYTYRDAAGALALQHRSEINARYTMGFAIGLSCSRSSSAEPGSSSPT